nr:hypothetical protein BaRGS_000985 [Batillaria attramentaria]
MNACRKKPAAPLHPIPVPKKKWSLVGMDIIGPLQVTDRGNQYIVALTDHFTKFPVAKAIPCKSSEEVARFMYETICIFGAFDSLITDQGREFINFALDILTDRFNINHRISSAYHPETNGQRERDNRTLKDTLVKITDNDDWDELLPAALFAYRTSVHKSTQFSPFLALYGEQAKLPFDVTGDANEQDLNEEIMDTMKGIHEEVKNKIGENISRAQKKQKEYYDSRRAYDHGFRIGDKVLIINAARVHRMGGKMAPRFVGPYEVISVLPKGRLQLKNTKNWASGQHRGTATSSKVASVGGQQVLECELSYPGNQQMPYMVQWRKDGIKDPILIKYDGYSAQVNHAQYRNRLALVNPGVSLQISYIRVEDEGWSNFADGVALERLATRLESGVDQSTDL